MDEPILIPTNWMPKKSAEKKAMASSPISDARQLDAPRPPKRRNPKRKKKTSLKSRPTWGWIIIRWRRASSSQQFLTSFAVLIHYYWAGISTIAEGMLAEREREHTHTHTHTHREREFGDKHFLFFEISCSQEKNHHSLCFLLCVITNQQHQNFNYLYIRILQN